MILANRKWLWSFIVVGISGLLVFLSCQEKTGKNHSHRDIPDENINKGKVLAAKYCQSCHMLPDPSLLDSKHWEDGVLPAMGPRLGIFNYGFREYPSDRDDVNVPKNFYPFSPLLSYVDWQYILDYYTSMSPDSLPHQDRKQSIEHELPTFKLEQPAYSNPLPGVCFTRIDTTSPSHQLILFDVSGKYLFRYDNQLRLVDSLKTNAIITDLDKRGDTMVACNMNVMNPNNGKYGKAQYIRVSKTGHYELDSATVFDQLARPVQVTSCDLNNDKKTDYLVCEFGNLVGSLSWMENSNGQYVRHVLRQEPGAIKAYVEDVNHDGLPDIWALFAAGDEGIVLFTNKGGGKFDQQQILRFPPIYGSTYFEFADFNHDGLKDILYTCGDNADHSITLKPYHGVYIFLNEGNNHFSQKYFFPMNGCFKAMARDFDGDGDLDIASISFFADFASQPEEGFVYLQNEGNMNFKPQTLDGCKAGRWLTMDVGDLDGDGKTDIVLGNFSVRPSGVVSAIDWKSGPGFVLLKNVGR